MLIVNKVVYSYFHSLICLDKWPFRASSVARKMTFPNKNVLKKSKLNKISQRKQCTQKKTYAIDVHLSIVRNVKFQPLCLSISE